MFPCGDKGINDLPGDLCRVLASKDKGKKSDVPPEAPAMAILTILIFSKGSKIFTRYSYQNEIDITDS